MQKLIIGFILGGISGAAAVFLLNGNPEPIGETVPKAEYKEIQRTLKAMTQSQKDLVAKNRALQDEITTATLENPEIEPESKEKGPNAFMEMIMAMGKKKGETQVDAKVNHLKERLGLTDAQAESIRAAMIERLRRHEEAGERIMAGKGSIDDLSNWDEDNYSDLDAEVATMLNEEQAAEYELVRQEREVERIEKKTHEDMRGLKEIADLSEEQKDQAWQAFVDLNAGDPPQKIPEGTTVEEVHAFIGDQMNKRIDALQPILNETQHEAYGKQMEGYREFIGQIINSGLGKE